MTTTPAPTLYEVPSRLASVDDAWNYIQDIDFTHLKSRMDKPDLNIGWTAEEADYYEVQYKRWLFLRRKYEDKVLPPSGTIDKFWHSHILDTRTYFRDCQIIFGYYLHHFPYVGVRREGDWAELERVWADTESLYEKEFGEEIYDFD